MLFFEPCHFQMTLLKGRYEKKIPCKLSTASEVSTAIHPLSAGETSILQGSSHFYPRQDSMSLMAVQEFWQYSRSVSLILEYLKLYSYLRRRRLGHLLFLIVSIIYLGMTLVDSPHQLPRLQLLSAIPLGLHRGAPKPKSSFSLVVWSRSIALYD